MAAKKLKRNAEKALLLAAEADLKSQKAIASGKKLESRRLEKLEVEKQEKAKRAALAALG